MSEGWIDVLGEIATLKDRLAKLERLFTQGGPGAEPCGYCKHAHWGHNMPSELGMGRCSNALCGCVGFVEAQK